MNTTDWAAEIADVIKAAEADGFYVAIDNLSWDSDPYLFVQQDSQPWNKEAVSW
jgi:hypothetical protein